jgi:hypothetical protein
MQPTQFSSNADMYDPRRKEKAPRYKEMRCVTVDPNWRQAPVARVRSPRESQKRRPQGWTDCRFILPRQILEGLRLMATTMAAEQRSSAWPRERSRYPRTLNYFMTLAANDLLRTMGYAEFCVEETEPPGGIRRFVAPTLKFSWKTTSHCAN